MIVLRENEWARNMVQTLDMGKSPYETCRRVARMYLDEGYSIDQVQDKLTLYAARSETGMPPTKVAAMLDLAISRALKTPAVDLASINIYEPELQKINSLNGGKQLRRLAFALLCLAKYQIATNSRCDYWVGIERREIMKMANVNTSIKRQSLLYRALRDAELIQLSRRVDNTSVRVCFVEEAGEPVLRITDFRNLGYQYMMYTGDPFFECVECGIVTKEEKSGTGRRQKYCKACAEKIAFQQKLDHIYRVRRTNSKKVENVEKNES